MEDPTIDHESVRLPPTIVEYESVVAYGDQIKARHAATCEPRHRRAKDLLLEASRSQRGVHTRRRLDIYVKWAAGGATSFVTSKRSEL